MYKTMTVWDMSGLAGNGGLGVDTIFDVRDV